MFIECRLGYGNLGEMGIFYDCHLDAMDLALSVGPYGGDLAGRTRRWCYQNDVPIKSYIITGNETNSYGLKGFLLKI